LGAGPADICYLVTTILQVMLTSGFVFKHVLSWAGRQQERAYVFQILPQPVQPLCYRKAINENILIKDDNNELIKKSDHDNN
jgi:hypothetical protein